MAMVRFATVCDASGCGKRSEEYTAWPHCRECGHDLCPEHQAPGTLVEADEGHPATALCQTCREMEA